MVVTEAPPPSSSRPSVPMMERKKKRAKTTDSMEHEKTLVGDPEGLANEKNKLPADVMHRLNRKNFKFEEERRYETSDLDPMNLREVKLIDFSDKVYVAPLTTVGNLPFRRIMVDMGADITCGEMAMAANLCEGQPSEWALLRRHECEKIFGVQIACGNGDQMGRCCELVKKYCEVDFVDVNMGCPIDPICNKGCGSTLMKKRGKAESVVKSALATLDCAVTFKIRTGWLDSEKTAHTTIGLAQSWQARGRGVSAVFLHGRSRSQRYSKLADWSYVERVVNSQDDAAAPLPVIGNGDVLSYQDWEEKRATAPHAESCAMLARGALIKPWLATEIKERRTWDISSSERFDILKDFVKYGLEHWGSDNCGIARTRRFLLEWLSFLHRYTPAGILEVLPQRINERPPKFVGRDDLETLMASPLASDWIKISEMLLGPVPDGYNFEAKHKSSSYAAAAAASRAGSDWG